MKIKNKEKLALTPQRAASIDIAEAELQAIDTGFVMRGLVRRDGELIRVGNFELNRSDSDRLFVVGIGKCSLEAVEAMEGVLHDAITDGIALDTAGGKKLRIARV